MVLQKASKFPESGTRDIMSKIVENCIKNSTSLSVQATNLLLNSAAFNSAKARILLKTDIEVLVKHIQNNLHEFQKGDLSVTLAALLQLKYVPDQLLKEFAEQNKLATATDDGAFILLQALFDQKLTKHIDLIQKLCDRLEVNID